MSSQPRLVDLRSGNWFWLDNILIDERIEEVPAPTRANALAVYTVLARLADNGGVAFPSLAFLERKTGRKEDTIRTALKELGKIKALEVRKRFNEAGGRRPNDYALLDLIGEGPLNNRGTPPTKQGIEEDPGEIDPGKNPSREDGKPSSQEVPLTKFIVDSIYTAQEEAGMPLPGGGNFGYHLGRAGWILSGKRKHPPTDQELEELPAAAVEHYKIKGWTDAAAALSFIRQQKARKEVVGKGSGKPANSIAVIGAKEEDYEVAW